MYRITSSSFCSVVAVIQTQIGFRCLRTCSSAFITLQAECRAIEQTTALLNLVAGYSEGACLQAGEESFILHIH